MVGGVVQETVKSRVSDNLWNLLTLARVRAIARLSQYGTAKNDAIGYQILLILLSLELHLSIHWIEKIDKNLNLI